MAVRIALWGAIILALCVTAPAVERLGEHEVVLDDQGRGAFPVNGGSVSVWVPAEAL